jgi:DNA-binding CsgD family transcriptional regulator
VEVLLEREAELQLVEDLIKGALGGHGGAVLLEGEAGMGKTRVMRVARDRAAALGAGVLYATADEMEADLALAAAHELLGRAAGEMEADGPARLGVLVLKGALSNAAGPGSRSDEVVHALWWLIVELADERPIALFLDDAQWADQLSLRLLRLATRRAAELPLALVVAARPALAGSRHAGLAAEPAVVRRELSPLSVAGIARMVLAVLDRADTTAALAHAREATGGNPLYLRLLLEHARDSGAALAAGGPPPPQLVRLVGDRLERLTPAATALARAVAILGSQADRTNAQALAGLEPVAAIEAEEQLRAERVLAAEGFTFAHPLVAAATRATIPAAQAADMHAGAARQLAEAGASDQLVAEHLWHAPRSGSPAVVATLRRAADGARRVGAPAAAARLLQRAWAEPPTPDVTDDVALELGRATLEAGDQAGERLLTRVALEARDPAVRIAAARQLAKHLGLLRHTADAIGLLRDVLATIPASHRDMALGLVADLGFIGGATPETRQEARAAVVTAAGSCSGRTSAERLVQAAAEFMGDDDLSHQSAAARALLARRLHREDPAGFAIGALTFGAMSLLINADQLDEAARAMEQLRADAEDMGQPDLIAGALWQQAQIAYERGDLARCELEARAAIEAGGDFARGLATPWLVMVRAEQGRLDDGERLLAEADLLGSLPPSVLLAAALGSRGRLRLAQGRTNDAIDDLTALLGPGAAYGWPRVEPPWRALLVEALVRADRVHDATEQIGVYQQLATRYATRRAAGHTARMQALIAPREQSIALLEQAASHFAASHGRLELARSLTDLGARRRAAGERRAARAALRDAHEAAHVCGATALCERARGELLLAGGRPRPPTAVGIDALTPAERRVAEIAATGVTNRDIARRLYLSPKTVEMHLRSVYRKLELSGREQLTGALPLGSLEIAGER